MNALVQAPSVNIRCALKLFAVFHLNIAFSSIEEEQRPEVVSRCYWPLLQLAERHGPIGIEATGYTLETIENIDSLWLKKARHLLTNGKIELIGSGYAQLIGPLVPARVNEANFALGNEVYERLFQCRPRLALVNEQAYSSGLVGLYLDAGYDAILMDWENPGSHHEGWHKETRYLPQRAQGSGGRSIDLLWTSTVAFQKLQRLAHGDISHDEYRAFAENQMFASERALCLYASDAEIFDFRPGRYKTEDPISRVSEWDSIARALSRLRADGIGNLVAPSDVLGLKGRPHAGKLLDLQSAQCPVPVKKQRKYTLARWSVTGRDDLAINAACQRIYDALCKTGDDVSTPAWKELCYLWSSDFRTHITESRWSRYCDRLRDAEDRYGAPASAPRVLSNGSAVETRYFEIATPVLRARLDRRRGIAIDSLAFADDRRPVIGGLRHGYFDDIALQADWYTGNCVFESPGEHKITDLEWCDVSRTTDKCGNAVVSAKIETARGPITKALTFHSDKPAVDFDIAVDWENGGRGCLRMGHVTLIPAAFDWSRISLTTNNGGKELETFPLNDQPVDHGAPVSFLVSSSFGFGMTEGWAEIGDEQTRVRVDVDRATAPMLGLLTHRRVGGGVFCQLQLSAQELDETSKPMPYRPGPRHFRFRLSLVRASVHS